MGVVGLGVGGIFALFAKRQYDDADCSTLNVCSPGGIDERNQANQKALVSSIAVGAGAAALGTAAVLWFWPTSEAEGPAEASVTLDASLTPEGTSLGLRGRF